MIMKKNDIDKYQPKLIEVGPVTVTVGGVDQPPAPSMMRIDVPEPDKLIQFRVAEGEEADNTLLRGETQHLISDDDALSFPDSKDSDKPKKKKKQKNKATDQEKSIKLPLEKPKQYLSFRIRTSAYSDKVFF